MSSPEIVEVGAGKLEVIVIGPELVTTTVVGATPGLALGVRKLDDLTDVEGADNGVTGEVLTKDTRGKWTPMPPTGGGGGPGGPLFFVHAQVNPSTVWLINHGLPFMPAGIEVRDHVGEPHYPVASWPDGSTVRLDFNDSIRGTARLS